MATARELVAKKGVTQIWSIAPDATVFEALEFMADKNVGALLVKQDDSIVGIVSERDYARKIALQGKDSRKTAVREIMTSKVICVDANQSLETCMALMTEKNIRHLPVLEKEEVVGLISVRDVLKEVIDEQKFMISQLEHYILGGKQ